MQERHGSDIVVKGTVSPIRGDNGALLASAVIVTPDDEEYTIISDEVGEAVARRTYDFVRVYGLLQSTDDHRNMIKVRRFEVLSFGSPDDDGWDIDMDGGFYENDDFGTFDDEGDLTL